MKIKNLRIDKKIATSLAYVTISLGIIAGGVVYYQYEDTEQICENTAENSDIFINDNGEICCQYEPGEHIIKITSNDKYSCTFGEIKGYIIKEVNINGWISKNQAIYVNTEPVIAVATIGKNNELEFNNFGEVIDETNIKTK